MLHCTEKPDDKIIKSNPHAPAMIETYPAVPHMIIIALGHFVTRSKRIAGRVTNLCNIIFVHHLVKSTVIAFIVHGANLGGIDTSCQGMTAGSFGTLKVSFQMLNPSGISRFAWGGIPGTHCALHPSVEGTVIAVIHIVA